VSQVRNKTACLSVCFHGSFFLLICNLCYHREIKELLIAYVFKCSLEMLNKLDYFRGNAAKNFKFKLGGGSNVVGSVPKWMA